MMNGMYVCVHVCMFVYKSYMYGQLLYLNGILSHWPVHKQLLTAKVIWKLHKH